MTKVVGSNNGLLNINNDKDPAVQTKVESKELSVICWNYSAISCLKTEPIACVSVLCMSCPEMRGHGYGINSILPHS